MPRDTNGNYSLPAGNPVISGTFIDTNWANPTMSDLGTETTNSLSRTGKGGMLAPLRLQDGTVAAPAMSFTSEPSTGLYNAVGVGDLRLTVLAQDIMQWKNDGAYLWDFGSAAFVPILNAGEVENTNLLVNFNFSVETPDDSQPKPDATPRSYAPDYQVFYGYYADSGVGVTDLTYDGGVINFSAGAIYQDVTYDGGLQAVAGVIASIAAADLKPVTGNVTLTDTGTAWRVSIESGASGTLSAKLEAGDKVTGHTVLNYEAAFSTAAKNGLFQGVLYVDPDAIGANPTAKIYPDGTIVGSTDNGSYTKHANGDIRQYGVKPFGAQGSFATIPIEMPDGEYTVLINQQGSNAQFNSPASPISTGFQIFKYNHLGVFADSKSHWEVLGRWK